MKRLTNIISGMLNNQHPIVNNLKSSQKVVIFGGDYCPFCLKVKELFDSKHVDYEYRNITMNQDHEQQRNELSKQLKYETVPMVFINNRFYGGCSDIQKLEKNGRLDDLINNK